VRYRFRMGTARKVFQDALQLDEPERAALALQLMDSLTPPDTRDEDAWLEEIEQRARRVASGTSHGLDADEAIDAIARDLGL